MANDDQIKYWVDDSVIDDFVQYLFDNFDAKIANKLWHRFYGSFNSKRKRDNYAFITSDESMALSYHRDHLNSNNYSQIDDNKWLVQRQINQRW